MAATGFAPQDPPWRGGDYQEPPQSSRRAPVDGRADRARKWDARPADMEVSRAVHSSSAQLSIPAPGEATYFRKVAYDTWGAQVMSLIREHAPSDDWSFACRNR